MTRQISPPLAFATLRIALGLGIAADVLFRADGLALGIPIWMAMVCLGGIALVSRADRSVSREGAVWLVMSVVFAAGCAWRASEELRFYDFVAGLLCLTMAAIVIHDDRVSVFAARLMELGSRLVRVIRGSITGLLPFAARDLRGLGIAESWARSTRPAVRVILIVIPLALVFGSLLRGADPIFASFIALPAIDVGPLVSHVVVTGIFSWLLAGAMRTTLLAADADPRSTPPVPVRLGMLETTTILVTLNVLFAAFVAAQLGWLFGGERLVQARTGLTAAEYARQGFFQTVWVVVLVLPLLIASRAALRDDPSVARRHTLLSLPVIALVGTIIVSAMLRMRLYVHYYGLSTDRFYTLVFMAWLGVVLLWVAATVLRGRERSFAGGAFVSGLLMLGALNIASPDAIVARVNIERVRSGSATLTPLDVDYLARLHGDAVPLTTRAIIDGVSPSSAGAPSDAQRCHAARRILQRWGPASDVRAQMERPAGWRGWNAGERTAVRTVADNASALRAVSHLCPPQARPTNQR
jgi:hypothetical protein